MSTKSTIFLTKDNEHCFRDCGYELDNKGNYVTDFIDFEMNKENISIIHDKEDFLVVRIFPNTDLHKCLLNAEESINEYKLRSALKQVKAGLERGNLNGLLELVKEVLNNAKD